MGVFESIQNMAQRTAAENNEFASRGLDVIPNKPEIHKYCVRKISGQMTWQFIKPCIFSLIVLGIALFFRFMRTQNGITLADEEPAAIIIVAALVFGIPLLAALLFYEGLPSLKSGKYELYGGFCLERKKDDRYRTVKMNGVYLEVDGQRYDVVGTGVYYYILRVRKRKGDMYFFAKTDKTAAFARTGDIYP